MTNSTSKPDPVFNVTVVTVNDSREMSTYSSIENAPFKTFGSEFVMMILTGVGSPLAYVQVIVLFVF